MNVRKERRRFFKYLLSASAFCTGTFFSLKKGVLSDLQNHGLMSSSHAEEQKMDQTAYHGKIIAVEEHVTTEKTLAAAASKIASGKTFDMPIPTEPIAHSRTIFQEERLMDMNAAGIDMQVLCPLPFHEGFDAKEGLSMSIITNNETSGIVRKHPDRFAGLAGLAVQNPQGAARELERSVEKLELKGGIVYSHNKGEYLDDKKFWCIFETAERLSVPIYLHPKEPSPDMIKPYKAYPGLDGAMWGYAAETGLHAMRLICSGVFDKYPELKIVLGHLGESLPYWLWRMDKHSIDIPALKKPSYYVKKNFFISTSGMFWPPAIEFVASVLGTERVLFAVDYPSESNIEAVQAIKDLSVSNADKEKIFYRNAGRIFRL